MSIEKTPNYNLNKPGYDNFGDVADLNENADIIDAALQNKVDKEAGKGLSEANFTASEKTKLAGIQAGAQPNAVTSVAGKTGAVTLDKTNVGLGNVDNTADANKQVLSASKLTTARTIQGKSFDGTANITLDNATTGAAGLMSAADKSKLNDIAANANNYSHPATHPASIIAQDAYNRFVTDTEKSTWNGKQAALGYTPVPDTRKVNSKALSSDITLSATDVGLGNVDNAKQMPIAGGTFTGVVVSQANTSYTTRQLRNVVMSTGNPSGGSNGDIWLKYV